MEFPQSIEVEQDFYAAYAIVLRYLPYKFSTIARDIQEEASPYDPEFVAKIKRLTVS